MPEVAYYVAMSLDGFLATPDGGVDWLAPFQAEGEDYGYAGFLASVDGLIFGRKTYEQVLGFGEWPYPEIPAYVVSRTPVPSASPSVTVTPLDPREVIASMKAKGLKRAWLVGGAALAASFHDAGLISEWIISIMPVTLGAGIPLLSGSVRIERLELAGSKTYPDGVVQLRYTRAPAD